MNKTSKTRLASPAKTDRPNFQICFGVWKKALARAQKSHNRVDPYKARYEKRQAKQGDAQDEQGEVFPGRSFLTGPQVSRYDGVGAGRDHCPKTYG